jgi:hypothetical protein
MLLTKEEEQQVQNACYHIGSAQIASWLRRIIELENKVEGLQRLYGEKLAARPRETVNA